MQTTISRKEPWIAGLLSFFLAGAGHIYCGKVSLGILLIIIDLILYVTTAGIGAIVFGVIIMITSIDLAKEINETIKQEEIGLAQTKKKKQEEVEKKKKDEEVNVITFIHNLENTHKLFINEIYSEEEFLSKKASIISNLYSKKLSCSAEDFLSELIVLKEQEILTIDEINKIKSLIL